MSDWDALLAELAARRQAARAMGGSERVARLMTARGKLDARTRLDLLFDAGSFVEIGTLVGGPDVPCDALVAGMGRIDGRPVLAGAEDFTVLGGSIGSGSMAKRFRICELALQERVPLVWMLDGAGHRLTDTGGGRAPNDLLALADLGGHVPMVCLVLGASAGHGALTAPLSDFVIMTEVGLHVHGRPAAREGGDRRGRDQGGARRRAPVHRGLRGRAQPGGGRSRRDRARAPLPGVLPVERRRRLRRGGATARRPRLLDASSR